MVDTQLVKIIDLLWNWKFHYRGHNTLVLDLILSKLLPVRILTLKNRNIVFNTILQSVSVSRRYSLQFRFPE